MEQYKFLKEKFYLPKIFNRIKIQKVTLSNSEVLMIIASVLTIINFFDRMYPFTIFLLGLIFPLYCHRIDVYVSKYYSEVLAVLLWVRLWTQTFSCLDVTIPIF